MTDLIKVALIAATPPTIVAFGALYTSVLNHTKIGQLHVIVNSRLTELLTETRIASHAQGKEEGIAESKGAEGA
jgi:hypothetical protein